MFSKLLRILCVINFAIILSEGLHLNNHSLIKLVNITDRTIKGLGFTKLKIVKERWVNPLLAYLPKTCKRIVNSGNGNRTSFSSYPKFQNIYSNCQRKFNDSTCFATCIFYGIIEREDYGRLFAHGLKRKDSVYEDPTTVPFPHLGYYEFHLNDNIFCFSKDFRSTLLNNIVSCKLMTSTEFCIIDEDGLLCDAQLGNCDFLEKEASVITSGNKAHILTCGTLDSLQWHYFENSSKLQCILPQKNRLLQMQRKVFKDCHVCSNQKDNEAVIEFSRSPSKEEFSKVAYSARPIVIRNGANFDEIAPLNFSILNQIYEDYLVRDWNPCKLNLFNSPFDNFSNALKQINEDVVIHRYHMVWGICQKEILNRFGNAVKKPSFLPDDYPRSGIPFVYATSVGVGDGVPHGDYCRVLSWQAQLSGDKTLYFRPPPECLHICTNTKSFEVTVNQGDFIGLTPNTFPHGTFVKSGDPSITIATDYVLEENSVFP